MPHHDVTAMTYSNGTVYLNTDERVHEVVLQFLFRCRICSLILHPEAWVRVALAHIVIHPKHPVLPLGLRGATVGLDEEIKKNVKQHHDCIN